MKLSLLAVLLAASSTAFAQPSQKPIFYPPTLQVVKSEIKGNTKTEVIYRSQVIVLGFLPRTEAGERQVTTAPLSSDLRSFTVSSTTQNRGFDQKFAALKAELLSAVGTDSRLKHWRTVPSTNSGWSLLPVNTLNASPDYGSMIWCIHRQRYTITGTRLGKTILFQGELEPWTDGPISFVLEKGRRGVKTWHGNFDIQTLPDAAQMEALVSEISPFSS